METKSFFKLLRKIIREEVQTAVRKEVRPLLKDQKINHKQVIEHGVNLHKIAKEPIPRKKKVFTKNGMLNDILNETATTADFGTMNQDPIISQTDTYPTMGNKTFNSSMAESFEPTNQKPQSLATTDLDGRPVDMNNENVANTVKVMTKDYSALMKAIDKKKGIS